MSGREPRDPLVIVKQGGVRRKSWRAPEIRAEAGKRCTRCGSVGGQDGNLSSAPYQPCLSLPIKYLSLIGAFK
jgi:hypothetical protein